MRWLADGSVAALTGALREVAPELTGYPIVMSGDTSPEDPQWRSETAEIGTEFVAKFAWSRQAALRVRHEISVLAALAGPPAVPYLPEVVVGSTDPLLLVTRRVPGTPLFAVADSIDLDQAGPDCTPRPDRRTWPGPRCWFTPTCTPTCTVTTRSGTTASCASSSTSRLSPSQSPSTT